MSQNFSAFIDESSAQRGSDRQEYMICAALIPAPRIEEVRTQMASLLRPGQRKLHWTDESSKSKLQIAKVIGQIEPLSVVVSHLSTRQARTERFRRKCLERIYYYLAEAEVWDVTLECRTPAQDKYDRAHVVALQNHWLSKDMRITHLRGGDEPLLAIPDAVLGAINAHHRGESHFWDVLKGVVLDHFETPQSL